VASVRPDVRGRDPKAPDFELKSSRWRWHLDEVFVKINGERHYL
jgi:transposase-like protein